MKRRTGKGGSVCVGAQKRLRTRLNWPHVVGALILLGGAVSTVVVISLVVGALLLLFR